MRIEDFTQKELENIQHRFDYYCKKSIEYGVKNQIRNYVRYCKKYEVFTLDDEVEQKKTVVDEYLSEKIEIEVGTERIYLDSYQLAEAIMKISERKRMVLLLAVVLEYSIGDIAEQMNVTKKTATDYKYEALSSLRKEIHKNGCKNK